MLSSDLLVLVFLFESLFDFHYKVACCQKIYLLSQFHYSYSGGLLILLILLYHLHFHLLFQLSLS